MNHRRLLRRTIRYFFGGGTIGLIVLLCWSPTFGELPSGGPYEITVQGIGISGGTSSGGPYTIDSSIGDTAVGISEDGTPIYTVKNGFAGQLYDLAGVKITSDPLADPPEVNEEDTLELEADQLMDDDTTLPLDDDAVTWSVDSGPILGVTADGLAVAGTVTGNTDAVVMADYTDGSGAMVSGSLLVKVLNDLSGGIGGDFLPNSWQEGFFGIPADPADAGPFINFDNDGLPNGFEFALGSDPTAPSSGWDKIPQPMFGGMGTMSLEGEVSGSSTEDFLTLTFLRRPFPAAVTYIVEVNGDLASGSWTDLSPVSLGTTPDMDGFVEVSYEDFISVQSADKRFMRVQVLLQNEIVPE